MTDLSDLFKVVSEGKKVSIENSPGKKRLSTLKEDLHSVNPFLVEPKTKQAQEVLIEANPVPEVKPAAKMHTPQEIAKALEVDATFQQPNPDPVQLDIKAIQGKLKFLEQAIGKIAATGPGSGEVNFRYLDDVNRSTLTGSNDNWLLEYDNSSKKVQFTNNVGPLSSVLLDTTGPDITQITGMLNWNNENDCLDVVQSGGTICQVGLENYSQVYNNTENTLDAGTFVSYTQVIDNHVLRMAVEPYIANGTKRVLLTIGVITEPIPPHSFGRATKLGRVNDIDTTGTSVGEVWSPGDELWAHPTIPGAMTINRPTAPNSVVFIGLVLRVHETNGIITVRYNPYSRMRYASFYCSQVQNTTVNTPTEVCYSLTLINDGFLLEGDNPNGFNEVVATRRGLYVFNYSIQFTSTNSSNSTIWVWLRKNDVDVPFSTSSWTISANGGRLVANRSFYFTLLEGDYLGIMWTSDSTNVHIDNPGATAFAPTTPSVIVDIHQINL